MDGAVCLARMLRVLTAGAEMGGALAGTATRWVGGTLVAMAVGGRRLAVVALPVGAMARGRGVGVKKRVKEGGGMCVKVGG